MTFHYEPGKMFLIDFDEQRIIPDAELKETFSTSRPYKEWMARAPRRLDAWMAEATEAGVAAEPPPPREDLNSHLSMFGFTKEGVDVLIAAMVAGKEGLGSMGVDTPLAVLSEQPKPPSHYFKQARHFHCPSTALSLALHWPSAALPLNFHALPLNFHALPRTTSSSSSRK